MTEAYQPARSVAGGERVRNFSPWLYWMARLEGTVHEDPFPDGSSAEELADWRDRRRRRFDELLGPLPSGVPLAPETLGSVHCEGYVRHRVVFDSEAAMSVPAYLLVPDDRRAPGPAVLAIHGHGPGKAHVCGLARTDQPNADYAHQLAQRGYVVLAPDLRNFGERLDDGPSDHYACDTNLVHAVMAGAVPLTQNLWDMARALDFLEQQPLVDPARLGVAGLSYGGTAALFLAAFDPRVAVAVVSGYLSSWASSHAIPLNMCGSQVLPGTLGRLEHVDIGALVAPRPMLVESGDQDPIFPIDAARRTVSQLRQVYAALGAEGRLQHDVFAGGHQWHGQEAYAFLDHWLQIDKPAPRS